MSALIDSVIDVQAKTAQFHEDGFLVLKGMMEEGLVKDLHDKAMGNFEELRSILTLRKRNEIVAAACADTGTAVDETSKDAKTMQAISTEKAGDISTTPPPKPLKVEEGLQMGQLMGIGIKHCFKEIVQRHSQRFEMPYRMDEDEYAVVLRCPAIMAVVKEILGDDCVVINKSLVVSAPGASDQAWHSDGPHVSAIADLPCHCLNVFVPLVEVTELNGPTQIRPGSVNMTRNLKKEMFVAMIRKTLRPIAGPTLKIGDVLLFDYRVLHRGTGNRSAVVRPVLVYTFAKPFYKDTLNFPRNSVFDAVSVPVPVPESVPVPIAVVSQETSIAMDPTSGI